MWRHYVYEHIDQSGAVFYVGKGAFRKNRRPAYERAHARNNRNRGWASRSDGMTVRIVAHFRTDDDAADFECQLIAQHGRENLVNLTDGGEGRRNGVFSQAERAKRSRNASGTRSAAWVASIRNARAGGGNGGVVKHGDKLPEAWRRNIGKTKVGTRNPMYGKFGDAHPNSRFVVDAANGTRYPSITAAAATEGLTVQNLHDMLTNPRRDNRTTMRLIG